MSNELASHPNLYLRQHGENPIHWKSWSTATWRTAVDLNRLVIVSIGYSACHWCHVMEKNCFEDAQIGQFMNDHFICIKVDREERPDVDQIYMSAVQAMGKSGGWPLNCVCLPDGRPIFAGTYLPPQKWLHTLHELHHIFTHDYDTVVDFASQLENHLLQTRDLFDEGQQPSTPLDFNQWLFELDHDWGGTKGAPKFPMPPLILFILKKSIVEKNQTGIQWVETTLSSMALGGLWDWTDGGFSRYSVDDHWHIPHFEKMLYDNAQLLAIYQLAEVWLPHVNWKIISEKTLSWIQHFLKNKNGLYFSATDADSEGKEGKYFCFEIETLPLLLKKQFETANDIFDFEHLSYWENGLCVLRIPNLQCIPDEKILRVFQQERMQRIPPQTDSKVLLAWNSLLLDALASQPEQKENAEFLWENIKKNLFKEGQWIGTLYEDESSAPSTLDALAFLQKALIQLLFITGQIEYWQEIEYLHSQIENQFKDPNSIFYFSSTDVQLFMNPKEVHDHVQPSANAVIAENLYWMGILEGNPDWTEQALNMTQQRCQLYHDPLSSAHWLQVELLFSKKACIVASPHFDVHIIQKMLLHKALIYSERLETLSMLKNKKREDNVYYVCNSESCWAPTSDISFLLESSI